MTWASSVSTCFLSPLTLLLTCSQFKLHQLKQRSLQKIPLQVSASPLCLSVKSGVLRETAASPRRLTGRRISERRWALTSNLQTCFSHRSAFHPPVGGFRCGVGEACVPAGRSCTRWASRCRGGAGRCAGRIFWRTLRWAPSPVAARRERPDAAAQSWWWGWTRPSQQEDLCLKVKQTQRGLQENKDFCTRI